jgi:hypothetical protein
MPLRHLRRRALRASVAALVANLLMAAATVAATGGGDFPRLRCLLPML